MRNAIRQESRNHRVRGQRIGIALLVGFLLAGVGQDCPGSPRQATETLVPASFSQRNDAQGFQWDVNHMGAIGDGTNDCFDQGLVLHVNGSQFNASLQQMTNDGREYVLSQDIAGVKVTRRILLDMQRAAVRYLEVFENPSSNKVKLTVMIRSTLGSSCQGASASSGQPLGGSLGKKDIGFVTISSSSRPCVMFLVTGHSTREKPRIVNNSNRVFDTIYMVEIKPKSKAVILHYVAQRRGIGHGNAAGVFEPLYRRRLIKPEIPRDLRRHIVNFHSSAFVGGVAANSPLLQQVIELAEGFDVDRAKHDTLILDEDAKLTGALTSGPMTVDTRLGRTEVPVDEVALLIGGRGVGRTMRLFLRNGEILTGDVTSDDMVLKSSSGVEVKLSPDRVNMLFTRASEADGKASDDANAYVQTHFGDRVALKGGLVGTMRGATAWGPLITPMEDIYRLVYVREPFPAYKLSLVDGSLMSTIVDGEKMKLNTLRFGKLDVLPHAIQLVRREDAKPAKIYDEEAEKPLVGYVRLVGENLLVSRLADDKLRLEGGAGVTEIDTSKVRLIERHEETDGMRVVFTIQMHDGSRLSGSFAERMLSFERAGTAWRIPVEHILMVASPKLPEPPGNDAQDDEEHGNGDDGEADADDEPDTGNGDEGDTDGADGDPGETGGNQPTPDPRPVAPTSQRDAGNTGTVIFQDEHKVMSPAEMERLREEIEAMQNANP